MLSPATMFIEAAIDDLAKVPPFIAESQQHELAGLGAARAIRAGATGLTPDFAVGYALGLQTARVILAWSTALAMKGIRPEDVL